MTLGLGLVSVLSHDFLKCDLESENLRVCEGERHGEREGHGGEGRRDIGREGKK